MTVDQIISLARTLTYTDSGQVSDADALIFLNIVYHDIYSRIVNEVDEDYFWDVFSADTIENQNEYVLPLWSATTQWLFKITRVEVKRKSTDSYFRNVPSWTLSNYQKRSDVWIQNNLTLEKEFYDIRENSIFIYPKPTEAITWWIKVSGIKTLIDLVSGGEENTIFPLNPELRAYHNILALGMVKYINMTKGKTNEKNDAVSEYEREVQKMMSHIGNRNTWPVEIPHDRDYNLMR